MRSPLHSTPVLSTLIPFWDPHSLSSISASSTLRDPSTSPLHIIGTDLDAHVLMMEGRRGRAPAGWPLRLPYGVGASLSSPVLYDLDGDGVQEIVVATKDANILFLPAE